MRLITWTILALVVALHTGCGTGGSTAPPGDEVTLQRSAPVSIDDAALRLQLLEVRNDSRCPRDVVCVWSGNAEVFVEARQDGIVDTLRLNTNLEPRQAVTRRFLVQLVALSPEPQSGRTIDPATYRATLRVSRVTP